jgi:hypothetical protein
MRTDQTRAAGRRRAALLVVLCGGALGCRDGDAQLGRALFDGARPLRAHLAGQDLTLPQEALRCANCHERASPGSLPAAAVGDGGPDRFATVLSRVTLTQPLARRGGPPSVYDPGRLCRAMRDGIDPAFVVIPSSMPRYQLSETECQALWAFLSTRS